MPPSAATTEKVVGVLGGMGPDATVDLMARVIAATPAEDDIDHIHMIVDNNPKVPSRIKALIEKTGPSPAPQLAHMAQQLVSAGADFLVMPCNTAHYYYGEIDAAVDVPVINLISMVVQHVTGALRGLSSVGLLASTAVQMTGLYADLFSPADVEVVFPQGDGQDRVMALIKKVKCHGITSADVEVLNAEVAKLEKLGIDCLVIACTELSVLAPQIESALPIFDAAQLLAEVIVREVKGPLIEDETSQPNR